MSVRPVTHPRSLPLSAGIELLEGLSVLAAGVFVAIGTVAGHPSSRNASIAIALLALLGGAGMVIVAWGIGCARRWGRAPAVITQILAIPVSIGMIQSGVYAAGVPLLVLAVVALLALFNRATTDILIGQ